MTKRELSKLYNLNREIEQLQLKLSELVSSATNATTRITGIPYSKDFSNKTALAVEIADLRDEIEAKKRLATIEHNRIIRYVETINNSRIRQIITYRHINGLTWNEIAFNMRDGNTEASAKMAYSRFFDKK